MNYYGKVGQSLSRCVRDILRGTVKPEDVLVIITRTRVTKRDKLESVMEEYRYRESEYSLKEFELADIMAITYKLWDDGKIHQPRLVGDDPWGLGAVLSDEVWLDVVPTPVHASPAVVDAYQHYEMLRSIAGD